MLSRTVVAVGLAALSGEAVACVAADADAAPAQQFVRPNAGPMISAFGVRYHPLLNARRQHSGVDFASPVGERVIAAASGEVTHAGRDGKFGIAVRIRHADGWETFYAHLSRLTVAVGYCVRRGDLIAYSGSTGFSTGPQLHFEIRKDGTAIDPAEKLALVLEPEPEPAK